MRRAALGARYLALIEACLCLACSCATARTGSSSEVLVTPQERTFVSNSINRYRFILYGNGLIRGLPRRDEIYEYVYVNLSVDERDQFLAASQPKPSGVLTQSIRCGRALMDRKPLFPSTTLRLSSVTRPFFSASTRAQLCQMLLYARFPPSPGTQTPENDLGSRRTSRCGLPL
jgi:hypothetical protein